MSGEALNQEATKAQEVAQAYHTYQQLLLDNSALDFGDLINYTIQLFQKAPSNFRKIQETI